MPGQVENSPSEGETRPLRILELKGLLMVFLFDFVLRQTKSENLRWRMEKLIRAPDDFFTEAQKAEDTYLTPDDFFTEAQKIHI